MPNWYQVPSKYTAIVQIEIYGKGGSGSSDGDGVAFIADSQVAETAANRDAFLNMQENLRDMPNVRTDAELDRMAERGKEPVFKAVALRGVGVLETLLGLLEHTFAHLERLHALEAKFGLKQSTFMAEVRQRLETGRP